MFSTCMYAIKSVTCVRLEISIIGKAVPLSTTKALGGE
jgi:hypothetical protein